MENKQKLRLFVWQNVLTDYASGMMVAYATDVAHARQMLLAQCSYIPEGDLAQEPLEIENAAAFLVWGSS